MKAIKSNCLIVMLVFLITSCNSLPAIKYSEPTTVKTLEISTPIPTPPTIVLSPTTSHLLSSTQKADLIRDLYLNNGGCELPCWWGIMPGRETLQNVYERFSSFGTFTNNTIDGESLQLISFTTTPPKDIDLYSQGQWSFNMRIQNGVIESLTTTTVNNSSFAIPALDLLLKNFGKPDEIWMMIVPNMVGAPYYKIILFYPKKGILVGWNGTTHVISETDSNITVLICPQNMIKEIDMVEYRPPYFHFWSPNENKTFAEINAQHLHKELYHLLSDKNSDINTDSFYETYTDSNTSMCFQFSMP